MQPGGHDAAYAQISPHLASSSKGEDAALSRLRYGFKSRRGYHSFCCGDRQS